MTKSEQIKKLFSDNREMLLAADTTTQVTNNGICYDGIVDENCYNSQKVKIVFLLKETNGNVDGRLPDELADWNDYPDWIRKQATGEENLYGQTFRNLSMWVTEFYNVFDGLDNSSALDSEISRKSLLKTAIINLKKTWGTDRTNEKNLKAYLNKDVCIFLQKEIEILDPNVIICGNWSVFSSAKQLFAPQSEYYKLSDGTDCFVTDSTIFVNFYHPACRVAKIKTFQKAEQLFSCIIKELPSFF